MKTQKLSFLEKLPVYSVVCSRVLVFVIIAATALKLYFFSPVIVAVFKTRFMFIAVSVGTVLSISVFTINLFKKNGKASFIHLITNLLWALAYFTFFLGVNKIIVIGICLAGIPISVFSGLKVIKTTRD